MLLAPTPSGTMTGNMVSDYASSCELGSYCSIGLIRWKIITHAFMDGKSRLITAMRASDNNRASTVFAIFEEGKERYGTPSHCRGDHGTENVIVAQ